MRIVSRGRVQSEEGSWPVSVVQLCPVGFSLAILFRVTANQSETDTREVGNSRPESGRVIQGELII